MIVRYCGVARAMWALLVAIQSICGESSASDRAMLGVVTPYAVGLGEDLMVHWDYDNGNGVSYGRFDIALYKCEDAFCGQQDCGEFVLNICTVTKVGCLDANGDFPFTVPSDLPTGDSYKIRVGLHDSDIYDCSSTFSVIEDIPIPTIEPARDSKKCTTNNVFLRQRMDTPKNTVFAPLVMEDDDSTGGSIADDDMASVVIDALEANTRHLQSDEVTFAEGGDTLMISWNFDDGFGGSFSRFNIDLYYCGGGCELNENCGEIITRLCEACPDSSGSEEVILNNPYSSHNYKIRVSTWSGAPRAASACSPKFEIRGRDRPEYITPSPTSIPHTGVSQQDPRTDGSPAPENDLPSEPVILPEEYPDWGVTVNAPQQPSCGDVTPIVRYAGTTARIYVEGNGTRGGCVTLTDIWQTGNKPLYPINPQTNNRVNSATGVWLLTEDLYVLDGITLQVHGTSRGGDCDELRLLSDDTIFLNLRAHGGSFSFLGTKVVSWDEGKGMVDTHYEDGRSYISAVSEVIYDPSQMCEGNAKDEMGESRMDIIDSEIGYLGYHESESYGLVWKVRGFCVDKSNLEVFDNVEVYGDIINSDIHHNYFGMYSYGHLGGNWSFNKMHDNIQYGFDPHDDSDYLVIHGNDVWGNGNHGIIASKRCDHVRITNNHVYNGVQTGLFLHRSSDYAVVAGNHVHDNGDAGLAVLESFYLNVKNNLFKNNKYGTRFSVGAGYNWIHDNMMVNSKKYQVFTYLGSDLPDIEGTTGNSLGNVFWRNYIIGTRYDAVKLKQAENTTIINNRIDGASTLMFDDCRDITHRDNEEEVGLQAIVRTDTCFTQDSDLGPAC